MTKADIFSGFLGAGKTTLIKKLIADVYKDEKIVLIENEFGEVGVDGGFLKDSGIEISELNSGCICCTLVGDFGRNLQEVKERFAPDRILIEPSGVAKLSDVMKSVSDLTESHDICVNDLVTVVNAKKAKKQVKSFGEFFNNQIEFATTVVLSRTDEMTEDDLNEVVKMIQEKNPKASVITTPWDQISADRMLAVFEREDALALKLRAEEDARAKADHDAEEHEHHHHDHDHDSEEHEHHHHDHDHDHDSEEHEHHHHDHDHDHEGHDHHHHHHADDIFDDFGVETPKKFDRSDIENILKTLADSDDYGTILRAKGMVDGTDAKWIYFDLVEGDYEVRDGEPDYTGRLCVIGCDLKKDKLRELFKV